MDGSAKLTKFKQVLMEQALVPEDEFQQGVKKFPTSPVDQSMPSLKALAELREQKQFHKLFLQNQLCRNIQNAMTESNQRSKLVMEFAPIPMTPALEKRRPGEEEVSANAMLDYLMPRSHAQGQPSKLHQPPSLTYSFEAKRGAKLLNKKAALLEGEISQVSVTQNRPTAPKQEDSQDQMKVAKAEAPGKEGKAGKEDGKGLNIIQNVTNNFIYLNKNNKKGES